MELGVAGSDRSVQVGPHRMLVDIRRTLSQLIGEKVDQVLHEITLGHEQILADMRAVTLQLVLGEEDMQELLVRFLMGGLNPLLQLIDV